MFDVEAYANFLLNTIPNAHYASGKKEICCRCMECGKKDHMYISIPYKPKEPSKYYCHKCHASGYVTTKKLLYWGIFDPNIGNMLITHNRDIDIQINNDFYIHSLSHYNISYNQLSEWKLHLINQRLGTNLFFEDIIEKKIILNLWDLLNENRIQKLTRDPRVINALNDNFLGFLSINNGFVNLRRLCEEGKLYKGIDKRYINYSIFDDVENSLRFYTIPNAINTLEPRRLPIHIAEGPFDVLSIYYNLRNQDNFGIYTSVSGSNYLGIIKYFLNIMKFNYIELHLYPDNDKYGSDDVMEYIASVISPFMIPLYIHRNVMSNEKDFGVHPGRIRESIIRLL